VIVWFADALDMNTKILHAKRHAFNQREAESEARRKQRANEQRRADELKRQEEQRQAEHRQAKYRLALEREEQRKQVGGLRHARRDTEIMPGTDRSFECV
jgi:hypothetical protein